MATRKPVAGRPGEQGVGGADAPGEGGAADAPGEGGAADAPDEGSGSYEAARDALAGIVGALEAGGLPLEESLALWERGERLAAECERWLAGARARLERGSAPGADATAD